MIRPTIQERADFAESAPQSVRAAALAMRGRFKELGIRPPFADDDVAWVDLADITLRSAAGQAQMHRIAELQAQMHEAAMGMMRRPDHAIR